MSLEPLPAFLAASALDRFSHTLLDNTFSGVYQPSWFDWCLLVPYFSILAILSVGILLSPVPGPALAAMTVQRSGQ